MDRHPFFRPSISRPSILGIALLTLALAGCAEEKKPVDFVGQSDLPNNDAPNNDFPNNDAPNNDVPLKARLEVVGSEIVEVPFGGRVRVKVRLVDLDGVPQPDRAINFRVLGGADLMMEVASASTDGAGEATNAIFGGQTEGVFEVLAEAPGASPVKFTVFTFPADEAAYRVSVQYDGAVRLSHAEVLLVDRQVQCGALRHNALPAPVQRQEAQGDGVGIQDTVFGDLPNGAAFTVVVVGYMEPGVVAAFGCDQSHPEITGGVGVQVVVPVQEVAPGLDDFYTVVTRLDLTDALPDSWAQNVNFVGSVFADPVRAVVDVLFGDPNDNDDGFASNFFDDTPANRSIVTGVLTDVVTNTALGAQLSDLFAVGGDAYGVVTEFSVRGQMGFVSQPGPDGRLAGQQSHQYDTLLVDWRAGCQDNQPCETLEIDTRSIDGVGVLSSAFQARVQDQRIHITPHTFDFNYGAIAVAIMERIVLPQVFGVNSMAEALGLLIDCEAVAGELFDPVTQFFLYFPAVEGCGLALDYLADELIDRLGGADLSLPNLSLATFESGPDAGCAMREPIYSPQDRFRRASSMGAENMRCRWDARFEAQEGDGSADADFYAEGR